MGSIYIHSGILLCRGRAYPDIILVQSKLASVCPRIIPEAGMVQRGRILWIDCDLLSFVPGNGPLKDVAAILF